MLDDARQRIEERFTGNTEHNSHWGRAGVKYEGDGMTMDCDIDMCSYTRLGMSQ